MTTLPFKRNTVGYALVGDCYFSLSGHTNRKRARKISFSITIKMSTKAHCALAIPSINSKDVVKVLDVKPWDSFRSVLVRLAHKEKMPDASLFAILVGRNNCINNNTIEYYGFYNGLLLHCIRRRQTRHGSFQIELESEVKIERYPIKCLNIILIRNIILQQNPEACSKSLLAVDPFPFEDLPLDVQRYCMQYLDFHNIIKLTQVRIIYRKILMPILILKRCRNILTRSHRYRYSGRQSRAILITN
jgi:hypothetical protein